MCSHLGGCRRSLYILCRVHIVLRSMRVLPVVLLGPVEFFQHFRVISASVLPKKC